MEDIVENILEMAKKAAPIVNSLTGTQYASAAVKAAQAIVDLIDGVKETASATQQAQLEEGRDELEARINAQIDGTIGRLG